MATSTTTNSKITQPTIGQSGRTRNIELGSKNLATQGGIGHIISQRSLLKCHISEESSFYVDSRNISFENIFVSSHSSEWSKNYPAMRKKSLSIPKMYF